MSKEIQLTKGMIAIVDDEDFEAINNVSWHFDTNGYASRRIYLNNGNQSIILMHRQILSLNHGDGKLVDHIDENKLNNSRSNLRLCDKRGNSQNRRIPSSNTSGYKGVCWDKHRNKWKAQIKVNGKQKHLGLFYDPEIAYLAYKKAAIENYGEFANFGHGSVLLEQSC